jgi:ADP-ribose pyrophosphatase YjhB (NUDIX family)
MPGGALDEGETVEEAVAREVLEETGLRVVGLELFGVFSDPSRIVAYPDGNVHRLLSLAFRAEVADGVPRVSEESLELRFVPHEAIRGLDLTPAQLPVLEAYLSARSAPVVE